MIDFIKLNPFCFSSEFHDQELGLVYYNYRHYSPTDGRWLSRDPIEEQGGMNLYGFANNTAVLNIDILGLKGVIRDLIYIRRVVMGKNITEMNIVV